VLGLKKKATEAMATAAPPAPAPAVPGTLTLPDDGSYLTRISSKELKDLYDTTTAKYALDDTVVEVSSKA
jgi:hypothetical protein